MQRIEAMRQILYLDADDGYSVQIVVWPSDTNGEIGETPVADFKLYHDELNPEEGGDSVRQLVRFLRRYKRRAEKRAKL